MRDRARPTTRRVAIGVLTALLAVAALPGIPLLTIGDLVVALRGPAPGLYRVTPGGGHERVVALDVPNAIAVDADNDALVVGVADRATAYATNPLLRIAPDGRILGTLATIAGAQPTAIDRDARGDWLVAAATADAALRVPAGGGAPTTAYRLPDGVLNAGVFDVERGGVVLGAHAFAPSGGVVHVADDGTPTTLAWGLGRVTAIATDLARGDFVVVRSDAPSVLRVSRGGRVTTVGHVFGAAAIDVAPDGSMWIAGDGACVRVAADGTPLGSEPLPGAATAIARIGGRTLVATGPTTAGATVVVAIRSRAPIDGGAAYRLAASTALRPALPLGAAGTLALAPTPLFAWTVAAPPPFVRGFAGRLDPFGRATATITVPRGLAGVRVFVGGVVLGGGRPTTVLGPIAIAFR